MLKIGEEVMSDWPINALTLREILDELGFKEGRPGHFFIDNVKILDAYPRTLQDDGMGYGVRAQYITEADCQIYEDETLKANVFNIFRDEYRLTDKEGDSREE